MLKEGYLGGIKAGKYPDNEEKIFVMKHRGNNELAPSIELLAEFNELKERFKNRGYNRDEARKEAWYVMNYERRFKEEMNNPKSIERMKEIKKMAEEKDVRLICYEKEWPCHRFILMELIGEMR